MKKSFILIIIGILILAGALFISRNSNQKTAKKTAEKQTQVNVVLDWTPNTNHTGIFVAQAKNWYKEAGLNVTILPYSSNATPEILLHSGKADVGVGATEGILSAAANKKPLVSIAAIIAHNTSGFLALGDRGIASPKDFDGKLYGGWGTAVESAIVGAIIKNSGGTGKFENIALGVDAIQALESKKIDFYWVFEGWEVIDARLKGHNVVYFPSLDYGIPDYYTPNLITTPKIIKEKSEILRKFMAATSRGYEFAAANPKAAAQILIDGNPKETFPDKELVFKSQEFLSQRYMDRGKPWGLQEKKMWEEYPQFLLNAEAIMDAKGNVVKSISANCPIIRKTP
mgnify:FL=1